MPLFDYTCMHCGRLIEDVMQRHDDPPPEDPKPCKAPIQQGAPCELTRVLATGQSHRFAASDGVGGWTRQKGGAMVRQHRGDSRGDQ